MLREINFDGIVGPSHNYAGLSRGNLASQRNLGNASFPRDAALQGIAKMRVNLNAGLVQGVFLPHDRPDRHWLARLGTTIEEAGRDLRTDAMSASAMWAANAATVSPAPDTADGRCHLTVANLATMPHRSHEWPETLRQMRLAFADRNHFVVHPPIPPGFGDEGAANHMRLSTAHDAAGVEIFIFARSGGPFPARQHREASAAVSRLHRLDPDRVILAEQSPAAIAAGAFHNDVVAVANEHVLFVHEHAFENPAAFYESLDRRVPGLEIIEVPARAISLADAVASYLFNAQLVTIARDGQAAMALILPAEAREMPHVWSWLQGLVAGQGSIRRLETVDLRQSMANGGGPACLRLRVVADPETVDPRFLVDHARLDRIESIVRSYWPERIVTPDLGEPELWDQLRTARLALLRALDLAELSHADQATV